MCVWSVSYTVHTIAQLPAPTPAWPLPHLHSADWATLSAGLVCSWYVAHRLKPYSVCAAMHEHTHLPTTTDTLIFHVTSTIHTYLYITSYNMHVSINVCIYIKLHTWHGVSIRARALACLSILALPSQCTWCIWWTYTKSSLSVLGSTNTCSLLNVHMKCRWSQYADHTAKQKEGKSWKKHDIRSF